MPSDKFSAIELFGGFDAVQTWIRRQVADQCLQRGLSRHGLATLLAAPPEELQAFLDEGKPITSDMLFALSCVLELPLDFLLPPFHLSDAETERIFRQMGHEKYGAAVGASASDKGRETDPAVAVELWIRLQILEEIDSQSKGR